MNRQFIAAAQEWLSVRAGLSATRATALSEVAAELLSDLPGMQPLVVGLSGAPGTGKSTLAHACAHGLGATGTTSLVLSLDDYYLPLAERETLAAQVHPLLKQRGPPGTHDVELLAQHLRRLRSGKVRRLTVPRFDKSRDDRAPDPQTIRLAGAPSHVFVEGWLVGARPQQEPELASPLNELERDADPDARWRRWTNNKLATYHRALTPLIDQHWHLEAPDWDHVVAWRWRQEQRREQHWLKSPEEVRAFLAVYERICRHLQRNAGQWADAVVTLDRDQVPHTRLRP